jgi:hypothetical protein
MVVMVESWRSVHDWEGCSWWFWGVFMVVYQISMSFPSKLMLSSIIDLGDENQFSLPNVIFVYNLATKNCFLLPKVICVYNLVTKNLFLSPKNIMVICVYNLIIYKENTYNYSLCALELLTLKYSVRVIC